MKAIIKEGKEFVKSEVSRDEAREMFKDQAYKIESPMKMKLSLA